MVGKTIYKVKIVLGKVKMFSWKILKLKKSIIHGDKYILDCDYKGSKWCYVENVGVILFLSEKEAIDYLISELEHFVELGEDYLEKTRKQLVDAKKYSIL